MCTEDSPSGLWRTLGKRVGCKPSGVRIPHPPPPDPGTASGSGVFVACGAAGVACGAAGVPGAVGPGRPRDRHTRASLGVVDLEARPCPPGPPAPSTPAALVSLGLARPGPAAAHRHRGQALRTLRRPPRRRRLWCCVYRPAIGGVTALLSPGLVPLDSEAFDDLCTRERGQDLARHKELRAAQARADAAPSDRARRVDEEPP